MQKIGIILDRSILEKEKNGKRTYEKLRYYHKFGKKLGVTPVFFHPSHVLLDSREVRAYRYRNNKLVRQLIKIPPVMHNRVLTSDRRTKQIIHELGHIGTVYNGIVERDKVKVHRMLWKNPSLHLYLPETRRYSRKAFVDFLTRYPVIYVKRVIGYIGHGVVRIERHGNRYLWVSSKKQEWLSKADLLKKMEARVKHRKYLVQQGIQLAVYEGETFDIRVSVQKNGERMWDVSGLVAKVANPDNKLSNLAQGGRALSLDKVFLKLFDPEHAETVKQNIRQLGIEIAKQFEQNFPSLADIGIDIGIDQQGHPYLIEVNVRDQRYSFYKAGELEMFRQTYYQPMAYGTSLLINQNISFAIGTKSN